jgi:hypothetical protein
MGPVQLQPYRLSDVLPAGYTYVSNTTQGAGTFNVYRRMDRGVGQWIGATLTITATVNASVECQYGYYLSSRSGPCRGTTSATVTPYPFHKPMLV